MNRSKQWQVVIGAIALCAAADLVVAAIADDTHTIVQNGRAFHPLEATIGHGETLSFSNQDEFIHQIYVDSTAMTYDFEEQPPGQTIQIKFPIAGDFTVKCHIHPKMKLVVHVK